MHMHTPTHPTGRFAYLHAPFMCKLACGPEAVHLTGADCTPVCIRCEVAKLDFSHNRSSTSCNWLKSDHPFSSSCEVCENGSVRLTSIHQATRWQMASNTRDYRHFAICLLLTAHVKRAQSSTCHRQLQWGREEAMDWANSLKPPSATMSSLVVAAMMAKWRACVRAWDRQTL